MSTRYGISVALDPAFTAGLHRARQVICSQYGCWAAEMHAVHLPLTGYFPCPEPEIPSLAAALEKVVEDFRADCPQASVMRTGTLTDRQEEGSIYVPFAAQTNPVPGSPTSAPPASDPPPADLLQADVAEVLGRLNLAVGGEPLPLRFPVLQYSRLPAPVFQSAARFARGVVNGLHLPQRAPLADLLLFRYQSAAAGDDDTAWATGAWATDLSWQILTAHPLTVKS